MADGDIKDEISKLPSWVWIGGIAAGAGLFLFAKLRGGSSSSSAAAPVNPSMLPTSAVSDLSGLPPSPNDLASFLQSNGYTVSGPGLNTTTTPAPAPSGVSFQDLFNYGLNSENPHTTQAQGNALDASQANFLDYAETIGQIQSSNPAFQQYQQQLLAEGTQLRQQQGVGFDSNAAAALVNQGSQFLNDPTIASQLVNPLGSLNGTPGLTPHGPVTQPVAGGGDGNDYASWEHDLLSGKGASLADGLRLAGYRPAGVRLNRQAVALAGAVRRVHTDAVVHAAWQDTGTEV